jgi:hypothetical protein
LGLLLGFSLPTLAVALFDLEPERDEVLEAGAFGLLIALGLPQPFPKPLAILRGHLAPHAPLFLGGYRPFEARPLELARRTDGFGDFFSGVAVRLRFVAEIDFGTVERVRLIGLGESEARRFCFRS